jgi:hypothetical protein
MSYFSDLYDGIEPDYDEEDDDNDDLRALYLQGNLKWTKRDKSKVNVSKLETLHIQRIIRMPSISLIWKEILTFELKNVRKVTE